MATTFPQLLEGHGLVLEGNLSRADARAHARAWLGGNFPHLDGDDLDDAVEDATIARHALWSDGKDANGVAPAGFVMDADFPGARPVTVVNLPLDLSDGG